MFFLILFIIFPLNISNAHPKNQIHLNSHDGLPSEVLSHIMSLQFPEEWMAIRSLNHKSKEDIHEHFRRTEFQQKYPYIWWHQKESYSLPCYGNLLHHILKHANEVFQNMKNQGSFETSELSDKALIFLNDSLEEKLSNLDDIFDKI